MRNKIEIVQIRVADVESGDVVNKRGPDKSGWIEVERLEVLNSGETVAGATRFAEGAGRHGADI